LVICGGAAAALVEVGPAVGFDARPPGDADPVFGLSLTMHVGPASVYVRGALMPTDSGDSSTATYKDEWERRYYSADLTPVVAFGDEETAPVAGVNFRQSRFEDYTYEGGEKQLIPFPLEYSNGETTCQRILALGGLKFGNDEGLSGVAWGGVGVALHKRSGTAWTETLPPEQARVTWSLDDDWKTIEVAAAAAATYEVSKHFGISGAFELTNRVATMDGDDETPSGRPFGFALFFAPVFML
jgi:hypothetical protein